MILVTLHVEKHKDVKDFDAVFKLEGRDELENLTNTIFGEG
jgi:hypothetical protein